MGLCIKPEASHLSLGAEGLLRFPPTLYIADSVVERYTWVLYHRHSFADGGWQASGCLSTFPVMKKHTVPRYLVVYLAKTIWKYGSIINICECLLLPFFF